MAQGFGFLGSLYGFPEVSTDSTGGLRGFRKKVCQRASAPRNTFMLEPLGRPVASPIMVRLT